MTSPPELDDARLLRYSRHLLLEPFGIEGQEKLLASRALVVGLGGLGSPAALYLAASGVGTLALADGDTVDMSNLQRQILHTEARLGELKTNSARALLSALNADPEIVLLPERLSGDALEREVAAADLVLDCSDNFATRHAINAAAVRQRKPLVSGAATRFAGQIAVFDLRQADAPCYHCLFPDGENFEDGRCADLGVFAPLTGVIGSLQAAEALKLLIGMGESLHGRLLRVDLLSQRWRESRFLRDPECKVCASSGIG